MNSSAGLTRATGPLAAALMLSAGLLCATAAAQPGQTEPAKPLHDGAGPRDLRPQDFAPSAFAPREPTTFKLANGIPVMLWSKRELPLVAVRLLIHPGGTLDDPATAGRSELAATMLGEGAGDLDSIKFADTMQSLGATFGAGAGHESATVSLTVLKRNVDKAMGLLSDAVLRPRMEASDWDRVKRLHLDDLKQEDDQPATVAGRVGARALFGDKNPYAWPVSGTPDTVTKTTLDDIKARQKDLFRPETTTILVAGDLTQEEAKALLEKAFGSWKASSPTPPKPHATGPLGAALGSSLRVILVDRPDAVQTVIGFMTPGYPQADARRPRLEMLNEMLGGSFTSRLNQNLREAHGYTYGARSNFAMEPSTGYFVARASVVADKTGESLKEFMKEFDRIRKGDISPEEVSKVRESLKNDLVQRFEGINGVLATEADLLEASLPFSTLATDARTMQSVTAEELNAMVPEVLPIEKGILVLVGDKGLILSQIKDLGLPAPVEYTVQGAPK